MTAEADPQGPPPPPASVELALPRPGPPGGVTAAQIGEVEPVIRRVIGARVASRAAVDDLVQDALERLLKAQHRLTPDMVAAFAVVTARNLAVDHHRRVARHSAVQPRMADLSVPEQPDEALLASEERAAMAVAVARLPSGERAALLAHVVDGLPVSDLSGEGVPDTTTRARLARSRKKLRVEYVLALRNVELPSPQCRPTLLTLAGGDRQRIQSLAPAQHLLRCPTCSSLSEPLLRRHRGLAAAFPFVVGWRALAHAAKAHPVSATAGAAATVAAGVAGAAIIAAPPSVHRPSAKLTAPAPSLAGDRATVTVPAPRSGTRPPTLTPGSSVAEAPPPGSPTVSVPRPPPVSPAPVSPASVSPAPVSPAASPSADVPLPAPGPSSALTVSGRALVPGGGSLIGDVGQLVTANSVLVEAVVTHNGFWIGDSPRHRVWVELVGPLRPIRVLAGDRISFSAPLVAQPPQYAYIAGLDQTAGAAQLAAQGAHISLPTTALIVIT